MKKRKIQLTRYIPETKTYECIDKCDDLIKTNKLQQSADYELRNNTSMTNLDIINHHKNLNNGDNHETNSDKHDNYLSDTTVMERQKLPNANKPIAPCHNKLVSTLMDNQR